MQTILEHPFIGKHTYIIWKEGRIHRSYHPCTMCPKKGSVLNMLRFAKLLRTLPTVIRSIICFSGHAMRHGYMCGWGFPCHA